MKRIFLMAVAALMLSLPTNPAEAAGGRRAYRNNGNRPMSRVVEMERRKNAWLRRTFLGQ